VTVEVQPLAPETWRVRLPLPGHSIGHVNIFVLQTEAGLVLIDTGWYSAEGEALLEDTLKRLGARVSDVALVLLTHMHSDHVGLAGALQASTGAEVALHSLDIGWYANQYEQGSAFESATAEWLALTSVPETLRARAIERIRGSSSNVVLIESMRALSDGESVEHGGREFVVIHTPPHTPGHVAYWEPRTAIAFVGDSVLPRINYGPTIRPPGTSGHPFAEYQSTLARLVDLAPEQPWPGHGPAIVDFAERLAWLGSHHLARLEDAYQLVGDGAHTIWEVASRLPRSRPWETLDDGPKLLAVGEGHAYIQHLSLEGRIRTEVGDDGSVTCWH
jgi:glyoxylase-like metal-dependent hydrolase (beta-lactamase superfamily II)